MRRYSRHGAQRPLLENPGNDHCEDLCDAEHVDYLYISNISAFRAARASCRMSYTSPPLTAYAAAACHIALSGTSIATLTHATRSSKQCPQQPKDRFETSANDPQRPQANRPKSARAKRFSVFMMPSVRWATTGACRDWHRRSPEIVPARHPPQSSQETGAS